MSSEIKCPTCSGSGWTAQASGNPYRNAICPTCHGTGFAPPADTGKWREAMGKDKPAGRVEDQLSPADTPHEQNGTDAPAHVQKQAEIAHDTPAAELERTLEHLEGADMAGSAAAQTVRNEIARRKTQAQPEPTAKPIKPDPDYGYSGELTAESAEQATGILWEVMGEVQRIHQNSGPDERGEKYGKLHADTLIRIQALIATAKAEGRQEVLRELREYASTHNSVQTTSYAWKLLLKGGATDEA